MRALQTAAKRESAKYGQAVPVSEHYFVMHWTPAREELGEDWKFRVVKPATLSFTIADDVRERLERGEPV